MTDKLTEICKQVEAEYGMGGLSDGLYADYAKEVAKRFLQSKQQEKIERVKKLPCLAHPPFAGDLVKLSDVLKIMEEK